MSAGELQRELRKSGSSTAASKTRALIKVGKEDCHLLARHFSKKSSTDEMTAAIESLERIVGILRGWLDQRVVGKAGIDTPQSPSRHDRLTDVAKRSKPENRPRKAHADEASADRQ